MGWQHDFGGHVLIPLRIVSLPNWTPSKYIIALIYGAYAYYTSLLKLKSFMKWRDIIELTRSKLTTVLLQQ